MPTSPSLCLLTAVFYDAGGAPIEGATFRVVVQEAYVTVDNIVIPAGFISGLTDANGSVTLQLAETETSEERVLFQYVSPTRTLTQDLGWGLVPNIAEADFGDVELYPFAQGPQG